MSRKHYEAIARIIRKAKKREMGNEDTSTTQDFIADELAVYFGSVNPNFNRGKFLNACCR